MGEVEGAARGTSTRKPYPTSTGKLATGSPRHEFGKNGQEKNQENSTNQVAMGEVEGAARGTSTRKPFRRALENWQQSTSRIARDRKQETREIADVGSFSRTRVGSKGAERECGGA